MCVLLAWLATAGRCAMGSALVELVAAEVVVGASQFGGGETDKARAQLQRTSLLAAHAPNTYAGVYLAACRAHECHGLVWFAVRHWQVWFAVRHWQNVRAAERLARRYLLAGAAFKRGLYQGWYGWGRRRRCDWHLYS
jgi:hypothetical protein